MPTGPGWRAAQRAGLPACRLVLCTRYLPAPCTYFFPSYLHNMHYDAHGPLEMRLSACKPPGVLARIMHLVCHLLPATPPSLQQHPPRPCALQSHIMYRPRPKTSEQFCVVPETPQKKHLMSVYFILD